MEELIKIILVVFTLVLIVAIYFLPTIIAFYRNHHYRWIILGINAVFGVTGFGFLAAFIWAVWPKQTAVFDIIVNDPTSNSPEAGRKIYGQMGGNVRAFMDEKHKPLSDENEFELRKLAQFRDEGLITNEDFEQKKKAILSL